MVEWELWQCNKVDGLIVFECQAVGVFFWMSREIQDLTRFQEICEICDISIIQ